MKNIFLSFTFLLAFGINTVMAQDAKELINQMLDALGGIDQLYHHKDVQYTYTYHRLSDNKKDVSTERYIFDGEVSWAKYDQHEVYAMPGKGGSVVQCYDGQTTMVSLNGKTVEDKQALGMGDFLRKVNYYWFAMFYKMADPGIHYEYLGKRFVEGINYDIVKVTFDETVGDHQDTYVLYLNPFTHLADQFLFNVVGAGVMDPLIMKVQYQTIENVTLPVVRKYKPAKNWEGTPMEGQDWILEISENIQFDNGFTKEGLVNQMK